jgi:hypothetical protein
VQKRSILGAPARSVGRERVRPLAKQVGWLVKRGGGRAWCRVGPFGPRDDVSDRSFRGPSQTWRRRRRPSEPVWALWVDVGDQHTARPGRDGSVRGPDPPV